MQNERLKNYKERFNKMNYSFQYNELIINTIWNINTFKSEGISSNNKQIKDHLIKSYSISREKNGESRRRSSLKRW